MHIHIHTCIHTYIHTYIHTHIYTHLPVNADHRAARRLRHEDKRVAILLGRHRLSNTTCPAQVSSNAANILAHYGDPWRYKQRIK